MRACHVADLRGVVAAARDLAQPPAGFPPGRLARSVGAPVKQSGVPILLIVEDEAVLARNLVKAFTGRGFEVRHAATLAEAMRLAAEAPPDVVAPRPPAARRQRPRRPRRLLAAAPELPVVLMTAYGSVADAVRGDAARRARLRAEAPRPRRDPPEGRARARRARASDREIAYYREREAAAASVLGDSPAIDAAARAGRAHRAGTGGPPARRRRRCSSRRDRQRQGTRGPRAPRRRRAAQRALHRGELHRAAREPRRGRALRPRARRLHRRQDGARRTLRDRRRRHHLPRRDRPRLAGAPVEVPEGDRGEARAARRRDAARRGRRAGDRGDEPRPRGRGAAAASSARTSTSACRSR